MCDAGPDTCGNPSAVEDEATGRIWLFMTRNYGEDTLDTINNGTSRGSVRFGAPTAKTKGQPGASR
ncbi:glycoside hydrolase [Paenibacillus sp. P26]|nr:glycoside hydrolase [Paenibacillus sp. P26]